MSDRASWMHRALRALERPNIWLGWAAAALLLLMVLLVALYVIAHAISGWGSVAALELQWHCLAFMTMLGLAWTLHYDGHVRVDIFYMRFPKRMQHVINIISLLLFVVPFCALLVWIGWEKMMLSYESGEGSNDGGLSAWWIFKSSIPLGFLSLGLQAIVQGFHHALTFFEPHADGDADAETEAAAQQGGKHA